MMFNNSFDTRKRQKDLWELLTPHKRLWQNEIMNHYPESLTYCKEEEQQALENLSDEVLWKIDARLIQDLNSISPDLNQLVNKLRRLEELPNLVENLENIPDPRNPFFQGMKVKKAYEISQLLDLSHNLRRNFKFNWIVDIGGGVGHLSRALSRQFSVRSFCLEAGSEHILHGTRKWERIKKASSDSFKNIYEEIIHLNVQIPLPEKIPDNFFSGELKKSLEGPGIMYGLHACGPLSLSQMRLHQLAASEIMVNVPCCYWKLSTDNHVNLSDFTKINAPIEWTKFALTLATRGHGHFPFEQFLLKKRVKFYRYGLHLFLVKELGKTNIFEVGEAKRTIYENSFGEYAKIKLNELEFDLKNQYSIDKLNQFYKSPQIQKEIQTMFLCNMLRWQFGRALEISLLLDRLHYLEEKGHQCKIGILFCEEKSSRNIALISS